MKVLYITHVRDLSGANSSLLQLITELRDNYGVEPFVVYPNRSSNGRKDLKDVLEERGIEGAACGRMVCFQREHTSFIYKIYFILSEAINIIQILFACRGIKFDLVHTNTSILDLGLYIAKIKKIPHIWHLREVASLSFGFKSIFGDKYSKWLYNQSDRVIAISQSVREEFAQFTNKDITNVIYNGVKPTRLFKEPEYNQNITNICIVGRVEDNKNQLEAVKAISILVSKGIKNVRLYIIGDYNNVYGKVVRQYVDDNNLGSYVEFMGLRLDVSVLLNDMMIGLMLSRHEAFGRVTIEYMQHKLFVVASNTSANVEIVKDGINGFLYDFGKPESLAEKIEYVISHINELKGIAQQGYNDATTKYLSIENSKKIFYVYKEILC